MTEQVFQQFAKGKGNPFADKMVWGGKGAALAIMAANDYPVPPGFTISTELCKLYQEQPEAVMDAIMADIDEHLQFLKDQFGYMPLLSVRSGAPVSMPGMMDTILNVGIHMNNLSEWSERIGERAAWDSMRRLLQMMGTTAFGLPHEEFENELKKARTKAGVETDAELSVKQLQQVFEWFRAIYQQHGVQIPAGMHEQLRACINAVFASWMNDRAIEYRRIEKIDESMGTAVTVQAMVFGNMNENSGSGVLFTRNPSTGEPSIFAEYLANAQGEDVVAGIRTPDRLDDLEEAQFDSECPDWQKELADLCAKLEADYKDMVDAEFTVQDGELFMLQSRVGKRSAEAAFRIAVDMHDDGVITADEMIGRVKRRHLQTVMRPAIDPTFKKKANFTGIAGSMGIATGRAVNNSKAAVEAAALGEKVILVAEETTPEDIAGMAAAAGILTRTGGATSHAAVVARGMDKPCVVGCYDMDLSKIPHMTTISIDGQTGRVWLEEVPVVGGQLDEYANRFLAIMLDHNGHVEQCQKPKPGACVKLADWIGKSKEELVDLIVELSDAAKQDQVMIDLTSPEAFGDEVDESIWNIAGYAPESLDFVSDVLAQVAHAELKNVVVVGGTSTAREMFKLTGYGMLPQAETLGQLMEADGLIELGQNLSKTVDPGAIEALRKAGLFKGKVMVGAAPAVYTAYALLAE